MAYRKAPHMNASLIREVRMIAQQFFQTKRDENFWGSRNPRPAAPVLVLKCARCPRGNRRDAITLFEGTAVCEAHL